MLVRFVIPRTFKVPNNNMKHQRVVGNIDKEMKKPMPLVSKDLGLAPKPPSCKKWRPEKPVVITRSNSRGSTVYVIVDCGRLMVVIHFIY